MLASLSYAAYSIDLQKWQGEYLKFLVLEGIPFMFISSWRSRFFCLFLCLLFSFQIIAGAFQNLGVWEILHINYQSEDNCEHLEKTI